jgi:hypothetical protein
VRRQGEQFISRRIIRRLYREEQPDVAQEKRVREALYGDRRVTARPATRPMK